MTRAKIYSFLGLRKSLKEVIEFQLSSPQPYTAERVGSVLTDLILKLHATGVLSDKDILDLIPPWKETSE